MWQFKHNLDGNWKRTIISTFWGVYLGVRYIYI